MLPGHSQEGLPRPLAHVVRLDQHVVGHQPLDQVDAQRRQARSRCTAAPPDRPEPPPASRAWRPGRSSRGSSARSGSASPPPRPGRAPGTGPCGSSDRSGMRSSTLMKVPLPPPSRAAPPKALSVQCIGKTVRTPSRARVANPAVDVSLGALRHPEPLAAAEQVGGLDADQHRELAALDHPARLPRVVDEPEPAAASAAGLGVDVVLQAAERLDLKARRTRSRRRNATLTGSISQSGWSSTVWATTRRSPAIQARCSQT